MSERNDLRPTCPTCGLPLAVVKTQRLGDATRRLRRCAHGHTLQTLEEPCLPPTPQVVGRLLRERDGCGYRLPVRPCGRRAALRLDDGGAV